MGRANGSRECAPDDELRDTHQLPFCLMGFEGLNGSYGLIAQTRLFIQACSKKESDGTEGNRRRSLRISTEAKVNLPIGPSNLRCRPESPIGE
jgi:hypothetical protein